MLKTALRRTALGLLLAGGLAGPATAAGECHGGQSFDQWLAGVKQEAAQRGVSQAAIDAGLGGVTFSQDIINRDRNQGVFSQTFLEFAGRMVSQNRMQQGAANIRRHGDAFARIQQQYGVPAEVIAAFWGLETDFGANNGDFSTIRSLASLAYDCRRPDLFRGELIAALGIVQRGDLTPDRMRGAWAGELGQVQFLPSYYLENGVDFDGDGHVDLIRSTPDVLASAANLLKHHGWRANQPWLQEVRVPAQMAWENADISIYKPRSFWAQQGVTMADGSPVPADSSSAALLLPMGRNGPAFFAYPNFAVYLEWNQSLVYATTAAYFATRLAGAPPVHRGNGTVEPFSAAEIAQLQQLLANRGYNPGPVDGKIGLATRAAVRQAQLACGLPADSYPTHELMRCLAG